MINHIKGQAPGATLCGLRSNDSVAIEDLTLVDCAECRKQLENVENATRIPLAIALRVVKIDPDLSIYRCYSGRGMFGATCVGIVGQSPAAIHRALAEAGQPKEPALRVDQLGLQLIVY